MKFCLFCCLATAIAATAQVNQSPQPAFPTPPVKEISPGPARSMETNAVRPAERTTGTTRLRSAGVPGRTSGVERSQTNVIPRTNAPFTPPGITNVLPGLNTTPAVRARHPGPTCLHCQVRRQWSRGYLQRSRMVRAH